MARVLLVDDDPQLLHMASALLMHAQHDVLCCENAMEAIEQARKQDFDVIVTDINMTPHSGFDLIRSLRQIPAYDSIPVAMLTGRREKRDVEKALAAGVKDYIVKPFAPDQFVKKVSELAAIGETARRTARFAQIDLDELASCKVDLILTRLTEAGVVLASDHQLHVGTVVQLKSDLFGRIGVSQPEVRITSCVMLETEDMFELRASFVELDERSTLRLRQFVQNRKAA